MTKPKVVSLFSGAGGLDLGFSNAGFEIIGAADAHPAAVATYNHNLGRHAHLVDVTQSDFSDFLDSVGACDLLLGGFPCQGFSKAGPKRKDDLRNSLYVAMIEAMRVLQPSIFLAENVDGLSQNYSGAILEQIVSDCEQVGYSVQWKIVDAEWFGVPQHRRRVFIVGVRSDLVERVRFDWPVAEHWPVRRNGERDWAMDYPSWAPDEELRPPKTLREAIAGAEGQSDHVVKKVGDEKAAQILRHIGPGKKLCNARHDATSVKTWDIPEVYGPTSSRERLVLETIARNRRHKKWGSIPNGNPLPRTAISVLAGIEVTHKELVDLKKRGFLKTAGGKWDIVGAMFASGYYKRPELDLPSPTVLTGFHDARFMAHPIENRPFSIREVARIQTFPDDFEFLGAGITIESAYMLIGNAVPPKLAFAMAISIREALEAHKPQITNYNQTDVDSTCIAV